MRGSFGDGGELIARFGANEDAGLAELVDKALEAVVLALAGNQDMIEAAAAGLESFFNRMQAVEDFHEVSLDGAVGANRSPFLQDATYAAKSKCRSFDSSLRDSLRMTFELSGVKGPKRSRRNPGAATAASAG